MKKKGIVTLLSLFLSGFSCVFAQGGKIEGTVQMADGTKLPGVTISIDGTFASTTTDNEGNYSLTVYGKGLVTVIARLKEFEEQQKVVIVEEGKTIRLNFILEMVKATHETTVIAERPLLRAKTL